MKSKRGPMNWHQVNNCGRALAARALMLIAAVMVPVGTAGAAEDTGGAPGNWLSSYVGARTLGLGGAFVATVDEPLGVVWNPAGLSWLEQNEVRFETASLIEGTALHGLSFAVPGSRLPSFGVSMVAMRSGEFERTDELNNPLGTFQTGDTAFLVSVAKGISPRFSLGGNVKWVRQSVEEWSGNGLGFDVGALMNVTPSLRVGASILNLGGPNITLRETDERYPIELRGGLGARVLGGRGLVTCELDHIQGAGVRFRGGSEYWIQPQLGLRLGYGDEHPGGGVSYRLDRGIQVDYGLSDQELGFVHRVGVSYRFGGFFASSSAEPQVFSPTGEQAVTKIHLTARTKTDAESWNLVIRDKSDQTVRQFAGRGTPPAHLVWDGKDETGLPLPDGVYRYRLVVQDREGREMASPGAAVEIATGGPEGTIQVLPAD
jgi:hypothetical protein